jgi:hypothetical protein
MGRRGALHLRVKMMPVLFLDFDGVLHRGDSYDTPDGVVSSAPGNQLFEFVPILDELLRPYPKIRIVLSTDWCVRFGLERSSDRLQAENLRNRIIGSTYSPGIDDPKVWRQRSRGTQVLRYVRHHGLTSWLAVDDRRDGLRGHLDRLVHCQSEIGLGDPEVIEIFRQRLACFV